MRTMRNAGEYDCACICYCILVKEVWIPIFSELPIIIIVVGYDCMTKYNWYMVEDIEDAIAHDSQSCKERSGK